MNPNLDRISLFFVKMERYISLTTLFSLALFLIRIACPDTSGGTGR